MSSYSYAFQTRSLHVYLENFSTLIFLFMDLIAVCRRWISCCDRRQLNLRVFEIMSRPGSEERGLPECEATGSSPDHAFENGTIVLLRAPLKSAPFTKGDLKSAKTASASANCAVFSRLSHSSKQFVLHLPATVPPSCSDASDFTSSQYPPYIPR